MAVTPILSVIVPVYRTEEYLRQCLASVANQTLRDIQVIVVNDGSPDDSQEIINAYEFVFNNFVSIEIENQGQSVARNVGLKVARGKYVTFLDSDDWIPSEAYELLVGAAERSGAEICVGIAETFNDKSSWVNPQMSELYGCVCSHALFASLEPLVRDASPCNKVFLRELLSREKLEFPTGISLREDLHLVLQAYAAARSVSVLPSVVYHYRARAKDASPSRTQEFGTKVFTDLIWVHDDLTKRLEGKISSQLAETLSASFFEYIQYRLYAYLAANERQDCEDPLSGIEAFLKRLPEPLVEQAVSPETRALLLLVRDGKYTSARALAIAKRDKRLCFVRDMVGSHDISGLSEALKELEEKEAKSEGWSGLQRKFLRGQKAAIIKGRKAISNARLPKPKVQAIPRIVKLASARVNRRVRPKKDIWLIGERRGMSAEDTGVAFFKHLRKAHPDVQAYFVTKSAFASSQEAKELGNVLRYGSSESYEILLNASVLAYSDNGQDLFPKWGRVAKLLPKDTVGCFLQHGVIGLHAMGGLYSKSTTTKRKERLDLFVTSSPVEKERVVKHLGYNDEEVIVTGLSRFDALSQSPSQCREILYMPSWREWLNSVSPDKFFRSEYFASIQGVLGDHRLHRMLEQHDYTLTFAGHFAMKKWNSKFRVLSDRVRLLSSANGPLQDTIQRTQLLITDYSSVAFDFAYQKRPILFYQFDAEKFYRSRGMMLIDPKTELLGPSIRTQSELLSQVREFLESDKSMAGLYRERAESFFPHFDNNNSERIYQAIKDCRENKRRK